MTIVTLVSGCDQTRYGLSIFLGKVRSLHVTPPRTIHRF